MTLTERIKKTKVKTTVDNNTNNRGNETMVKTSNTIGIDSLLVNVNEAIELMLPSTLSGLGVIGETCMSVVEGVDEKKGRSTDTCTGSNVTSKPHRLRSK